jgi:DNA topoisomerase-1
LPSCPAIGCDGHLTARKSRFGKTFFSCSNYPDCDVIVNDLDQVSTKYPNHPKTPYVKKAKGKGGKGNKKGGSRAPAQAAYKLSAELSALLGEKELTRPQVTKKIWEYIKANKLQDPKNKRLIVPDAKLAKIFGSKEPIDMLKLASVLNPHFKK